MCEVTRKWEAFWEDSQNGHSAHAALAKGAAPTATPNATAAAANAAKSADAAPAAPSAASEPPQKKQRVDDSATTSQSVPEVAVGKWPSERSMHSLVSFADRFLVVFAGVSPQEDHLHDLV